MSITLEHLAMKSQLAKLLPVLEGFKVRIDESGKVLDKPEYKDYCSNPENYESLNSLEWSKAIETYNQGKEVIRMPRVMGFIDAQEKYTILKFVKKGEAITSPFDNVRSYKDFAKTTPQLSHYIACDEEGKPLEEPPFTIGKKGTKIYSVGSVHIDKWKATQSNVIFHGWETYKVETDEANGITRIKMIGVSANFYEILFFNDGLIRMCATTKVFENPNYEDAFIAVPHYVDFNKSK